MRGLNYLAISLVVVGVAAAGVVVAMDRLKPQQEVPVVSDSLSEGQKTAVEGVVRSLLEREPELIVKAAESAGERASQAEQKANEQSLSDKKEKLFNDPRDPVTGNPKGDVTVVEFFDYQCGYCKRAQESVRKLLDSDPNVRLVFKEYPILGLGSEISARAALASIAQGKYVQFHEALMASSGQLTEENVMKIAKSVGLDTAKLQAALKSAEVTKLLSDNRELGMSIGARGTPTFIIGDKIIPGALPFEQMKELVERAREKNGAIPEAPVETPSASDKQ